MSEQRKQIPAPRDVGAITQFVRTLRLVWRLLNDPRVPLPSKLIIPGAMVYLLFPVDFLPDVMLGLGQLDDMAILGLAVALFIEFCPRKIVEEHRRAIAAEGETSEPPTDNVIEGTYREVKDDHSESS